MTTNYNSQHLEAIASALHEHQPDNGLSMRAADALTWAAEEIDRLKLSQRPDDFVETMELLNEKLQTLHHKLLTMAGITHFPPETRQ